MPLLDDVGTFIVHRWALLRAAGLVLEGGVGLAHALVDLDRPDTDPELEYASEELAAESVAFIVCGALGLDTAGNSVPYLASWAEHTPEDAFRARRRARRPARAAPGGHPPAR